MIVLLVVCEAFLSVLTVYTLAAVCTELFRNTVQTVLKFAMIQDPGVNCASFRPPLWISGHVLTACEPDHLLPPHSSKVCYTWNFTAAYSECLCAIVFRRRDSYIFVFN